MKPQRERKQKLRLYRKNFHFIFFQVLKVSVSLLVTRASFRSDRRLRDSVSQQSSAAVWTAVWTGVWTGAEVLEPVTLTHQSLSREKLPEGI